MPYVKDGHTYAPEIKDVYCSAHTGLYQRGNKFYTYKDLNDMKEESKNWQDFDITKSPFVQMNMMAYYDVNNKECIFQAGLDKEKYKIDKVEVVEENGKFIINVYHRIKANYVELR